MPRKYPVFLTVLNIFFFFFINGTHKEQVHATQAVMCVLWVKMKRMNKGRSSSGRSDAGQSVVGKQVLLGKDRCLRLNSIVNLKRFPNLRVDWFLCILTNVDIFWHVLTVTVVVKQTQMPDRGGNRNRKGPRGTGTSLCNDSGDASHALHCTTSRVRSREFENRSKKWIWLGFCCFGNKWQP